MKDPEKTLGNIIDHQSVAVIGSVDGDGFPRTKAMFAPRKRTGIKEFYFTTNTSSQRVAQYRKNPKATVYFQTRRFGFHGLEFIGTMEILEDAEIKKEIWRDGDDKYYDGVTDPDYCILKFTAVKCRYYSNLKKIDLDL